MPDWSKKGFSPFVVSVLERFPKLNEKKVTKKHWGAAVAIGTTTYGQMSLAIIDKGGFSSRHYHKQKVNVFSVCEGTLVVNEWSDEKMDVDTRMPDKIHFVKAGESLQMPVDVMHEMEAGTDVVLMESYHTVLKGHKVCPSDIFRVTTGGKK